MDIGEVQIAALRTLETSGFVGVFKPHHLAAVTGPSA